MVREIPPDGLHVVGQRDLGASDPIASLEAEEEREVVHAHGVDPPRIVPEGLEVVEEVLTRQVVLEVDELKWLQHPMIPERPGPGQDDLVDEGADGVGDRHHVFLRISGALGRLDHGIDERLDTGVHVRRSDLVGALEQTELLHRIETILRDPGDAIHVDAPLTSRPPAG